MVSVCEHPDAAEVVRRRAVDVEADLFELPGFASISGVTDKDGRYTFDLALNGDRFRGITAPFRGKFQMKNATAAVAAAWRLRAEGYNVRDSAIVEGMRKASWRGRLEVVLESPLVVLDGAHNPAAIREIAGYAKEQWAGRRIRLIYASMRDKAIGEISEILFPLANEVYLTRPGIERAATPEEIMSQARHRPEHVVVESDPARALDAARRASAPNDVVLACGSLFLVGELLGSLNGVA